MRRGGATMQKGGNKKGMILLDLSSGFAWGDSLTCLGLSGAAWGCLGLPGAVW